MDIPTRRALPLVNALAITTALTGQAQDVHSLPRNARSLSIQGALTYGSGGTTCKVWVQTSLDGGTTWVDIACLAFATASARKVVAVKLDTARAVATPADGALADDSVVDGLLGDRIRAKVTTTGTYAASTFNVHCVVNE